MVYKIKKFIKNFIPYGLIDKHTETKQLILETTGISPILYNDRGEVMHFYYLRDAIASHNPYSFGTPGENNRYIVWDRYNEGLPIHFYSHNDIFYSGKSAKKKFGLLLESEAIVPDHYNRILEEVGTAKEYTGIFTPSARVLDKYEHAHFTPGGSVWYGTAFGGGNPRKDLFQLKCKNISLVSSNKAVCELHEYRKAMAFYYMKSDLVDTFGTFDGGKEIQIADSLTDYRYSIAIENIVTPYYFTEKILNCFASMTIPIYIGASRIGEFFNVDGIIQISPMDFNDLDQVLRGCCEEDYLERKEAILDNYNRVWQYKCHDDYLYEHYADLFEV